jgi:hypothetical protein
MIDESNVHLVFAWDDDQYNQQCRQIKAQRREAKLAAHEHPESRAWRLMRAVHELIAAEYPDPPLHVEHSRRLVGVAALLVSADTLPMLGEFGLWEWASKVDTSLEPDPANPNHEFWRELSREPIQDGPHKSPLDALCARHEGREEVLFQRMPGEGREIQSQRGNLARFRELLSIALDELEHSPVTTDSATAPDGFYSPTDIAKAMKAPRKAAAIRMALKRLFDEDRLPGSAWMENSNPARGQARILYRFSVVRPLLSRFEVPQAD